MFILWDRCSFLHCKVQILLKSVADVPEDEASLHLLNLYRSSTSQNALLMLFLMQL